MIRLQGVEKSYPYKGGQTWVLRQIGLEIAEGDFVTIMGPSGSGKSTLLAILGMLDGEYGGEYWFDEKPVHKASVKERGKINKENVGFVFQHFHSARRPDGLREPRDPAVVPRRGAQGARGARRRDPRSLPDGRQEGPLSDAALGRPAAASRRRARRDREPARRARRRADGQPALEPGRRDHEAAERLERRAARRSSRCRTTSASRRSAAASSSSATAGSAPTARSAERCDATRCRHANPASSWPTTNATSSSRCACS